MPHRKPVATIATMDLPKAICGSKAGCSPAACRAGIEIRIENHYAAKIYTSGAPVTGQAVVSVQRNTHFERIVIQLTGIATTRNYMTPEIEQALHHFLILEMPLDASSVDLPKDGMLRAGSTYRLPFHFVVPQSLPIGSCREPCEHPSVREHHLRLPPSMGGWGDRDDDAPDTAKIEYGIVVSVLQRTVFSSEPAAVLRCRQEINVLPLYAEDAPLDIDPRDRKGEYKLVKSKPVRKSLLSRKQGTVTAEAAQPAAVTLSCDAREASSSRLPLRLLFSPASSSCNASPPDSGKGRSPPIIHSVTAKLVTKTYFNTAHLGSFPDRGLRQDLNHSTPLFYSRTTPVFDTQFTSTADWQVQTGSCRPLSWSNALNVAFTLPLDSTKTILLPTFHSCILSRTYTLRIMVSLGPGRTSITLSLPLQILVDQSSLATAKIPRGLSCNHETLQRPGSTDATLPKYKDHLFVRARHHEDNYGIYLAT